MWLSHPWLLTGAYQSQTPTLPEAAGQSPAAGWDMRDLGDGLHLLGAPDADLGRTQGAASGLSALAGLQGLPKERTVC